MTNANEVPELRGVRPMWAEHWADNDGSADFYRVRPRLAMIVTRGSLYASALPALMVHLGKVVRDDNTTLYWDAGELLGTSGLSDISAKLLATQDAAISEVACCYDSPMVGVELSMMQMSYAKPISFYLSRSAWADQLQKTYQELTGQKLETERYRYSNLSSASSSSVWRM